MTIKELRLQTGMTQQECAKYLEISLRTYQNYENDNSKTNSSRYNSYCKKLQSYNNTSSINISENNSIFHTKVLIGNDLQKACLAVKNYKKRSCFDLLKKFLDGDYRGRVGILYGLRRTGKTTLLFQAILELPKDKTAYIKIQTTDNMNMLSKDLDLLYDLGYEYVFIDEITLLEDFIDTASVLSDIFSMMGMKIVLSGTDSLGFWISLSEELYDRAYSFHTTFIPYREYSRLLNINDIDEYIKYGGTLRKGDNDFDDEDALSPDATFRDDETTRKYIDTAICKNIQHSLVCYKNERHFMSLKELYEADELTGAINRIIEKSNHEFLLKVLTENFKSHDLGSAKQILIKEHNYILYDIDVSAVTSRLMEILEIKNKEAQSINLTEQHVAQIEKYLKALGLIENCEIRYEIGGVKEYPILTQPGMRYCQALALIYSIMKEDEFRKYTDDQQQYAIQKISNDVCGKMLEDIVLLETCKALNKKRYYVFKYVFTTGKYDMVVYDKEDKTASIYEVKHSTEITQNQARYLRDKEKLNITSQRIGTIKRRCVLYRGKNHIEEDGIEYINVEEYLKNLES